MVIIELVDFIHTTIGDDKNCDCPSLLPRSEQENIKSGISHLINLLKKSINDKLNHLFSFGFENIGEFQGTKPSSSFVYDLAISEQFNRVIVGQGSLLKVFHRALKNQQDVNLELLFEVDYGNNYSFHCMKLIKENNEEFLYVSDFRYHALKIKVVDLMNRQNTTVWKSQQSDTSVSYINVWGLDIIHGRVYTIDYEKGIKAFDSATGFEIIQGSSSDNSSTDHFPDILEGYDLRFLSEKEMLVSHTQRVELFEKEQDVWKSVRKSKIRLINAHSIFYEERSNLIYISDSVGHAVHVIRKDTLQVVKRKTDFRNPLGMIVDRKSGLLYVSDTRFSVSIFQ